MFFYSLVLTVFLALQQFSFEFVRQPDQSSSHLFFILVVILARNRAGLSLILLFHKLPSLLFQKIHFTELDLPESSSDEEYNPDDEEVEY